MKKKILRGYKYLFFCLSDYLSSSVKWRQLHYYHFLWLDELNLCKASYILPTRWCAKKCFLQLNMKCILIRNFFKRRVWNIQTKLVKTNFIHHNFSNCPCWHLEYEESVRKGVWATVFSRLKYLRCAQEISIEW